jgi:hypothetical protein
MSPAAPDDGTTTATTAEEAMWAVGAAEDAEDAAAGEQSRDVVAASDGAAGEQAYAPHPAPVEPGDTGEGDPAPRDPRTSRSTGTATAASDST